VLSLVPGKQLAAATASGKRSWVSWCCLRRARMMICLMAADDGEAAMGYAMAVPEQPRRLRGGMERQ